VFLCRTSRTADGLQLLQQAREVALRNRGPADPLYVPVILELNGYMLSEAGRPEAGLEMLMSAVAAWRKYRPQSNFLLSALERQASAHLQLGDLASADRLLLDAQAIRDALHDEETNRNMNTLVRADWLVASDQPQAALDRLRSYRLVPGQSAPESLTVMRRDLAAAEAHLALGELAQARELAGGVYERVAASAQRGYLVAYEAQAALAFGRALRQTGAPAEAQAYLQAAVKLRSSVTDPEASLPLADAQIALAHCLLDLRRASEARVWTARARAIHAVHPVLGEVRRQPLRDLEARLAGI
jgi:hypothetical protein